MKLRDTKQQSTLKRSFQVHREYTSNKNTYIDVAHKGYVEREWKEVRRVRARAIRSLLSLRGQYSVSRIGKPN